MVNVNAGIHPEHTQSQSATVENGNGSETDGVVVDNSSRVVPQHIQYKSYYKICLECVTCSILNAKSLQIIM